jgi:hypothetical protein
MPLPFNSQIQEHVSATDFGIHAMIELNKTKGPETGFSWLCVLVNHTLQVHNFFWS